MKFRPSAITDRKLEAYSSATKHARPNNLRHKQVLPPHNVDLTLKPTTLEQMRAFPKAKK